MWHNQEIMVGWKDSVTTKEGFEDRTNKMQKSHEPPFHPYYQAALEEGKRLLLDEKKPHILDIDELRVTGLGQDKAALAEPYVTFSGSSASLAEKVEDGLKIHGYARKSLKWTHNTVEMVFASNHIGYIILDIVNNVVVNFYIEWPDGNRNNVDLNSLLNEGLIKYQR
jgi:hypothetical protein